MENAFEQKSRGTDEVAVMIDTRDSLLVDEQAAAIEWQAMSTHGRLTFKLSNGKEHNTLKLASLKNGGRDGALIVVNRELTHYVSGCRRGGHPATCD